MQIEDLKDAFVQSFPRGEQYQLLYVDPPISYNISFEKQRSKPRAPAFELDDLINLPVPEICDKDCIMLIWSTCAHLDKTMELAKAWGFAYTTVWKVLRKCHSDGHTAAIVPGYYNLSNHELLLLFKRGKISKFKNPVMRGREHQEHISTKPRCSAKPSDIRDRILANFLVEKRIELFAKETTTGWDSWGLDLESFSLLGNCGEAAGGTGQPSPKSSKLGAPTDKGATAQSWDKLMLPTLQQNFVCLDKISRQLPDKHRPETYGEVVGRYFCTLTAHLADTCNYTLTTETIEPLKAALLNLDILPSTRIL